VRTVLFQIVVLALGLVAFPTTASAQPKDMAPKPITIYGQFRDLINEGKFDIAASFLQAFLDSNPTETEFLDLEKKYGSTTFTGLRAIPKWSDDAVADKKARANVEIAVTRSKNANAKLLQDPARVDKYIRNLGATYEERIFAEEELRRTGEFAIPYMVDRFRTTPAKDSLYEGILGAIPKLEPQTVAGWVAALDGFTPEQQFGVISAIASRPDIITLQSTAQSDLAPALWHILLQPREQSPTLRAFAETLLNKLRPGAKADTKLAEAELTALGYTFYDHTARYAGAKVNPDGSPTTVPLWQWEAKAEKLTKFEDVPLGQAEEYYGLKYARWVLERKSDYEPAQGLVLSLAAERAIERAKFGSLAKAEPAVFKLLSDAPSTVLGDLLNGALNRKKTALALAMLQVLGDRADRDAATPPAGTVVKPSLLVKALSFPDPQVQFAAANALLRSPVPVPPAVRGQIVDILRRAAAADPGTPSNSKGTALITDPNKIRADASAVLFRALGYDVEVFTSGRDLLRRVARASDFDVIYIDHHAANPELIDVVGQLQSDAKAGNRPTFVVASADKPRVPTFDQLVIRFSALIAATENEIVKMPSPYVPKSDETKELIAKQRDNIQQQRDGVFRNTAPVRMARMNRLIDTTGLNLTATQKLLLALRVELIAYSALGAEYPISPESSPGTVQHLIRLRKQLDAQPASPLYGVGLPTTDMLKLLERFEIDLARQPTAKKRFEDIYAKIDPVELGLPIETFRDPVAEARLKKTLVNYPSVRVIPEPFGRTSLAADLQAAQGEPGQAPRDPAEKRASQKAAIEWFRRMAIGETPGFDIKSAETEIRDALRVDDLSDAAIDAVSKFGTGDAQQSLLILALNTGKPLPLRNKAADAVIRHIQINGRSIPKTLIDPLAESADKEPDLGLRAKLLTLKGMLAFNAVGFADSLKGYNPPLLPVAVPPKVVPMEPKEVEPKKEP